MKYDKDRYWAQVYVDQDPPYIVVHDEDTGAAWTPEEYATFEILACSNMEERAIELSIEQPELGVWEQ